MKISWGIFFAAFMILVGSDYAHAADELMNIGAAPRQEALSIGKVSKVFVPGVAILLPDGRGAVIEKVLPNGELQTDLGVVLLADGSLKDNPSMRARIVEEAVKEVKDGVAEEVNVKDEAAEDVKIIKDGVVEEVNVKGGAVEEGEDLDNIIEEELGKVAVLHTPDSTGREARPERTVAGRLPLTSAKSRPAQANGQSEKKAEPVKTGEKKAPIKQSEKKTPPVSEKPVKKAEKSQKTRVGQELRIPEEAIATGNLDFLEGCWQGTRPEYYSKRIIKECFCFGRNGKGGKRRVIDPIGDRKCIGATSATLSGNGVLSVTSKGAVCDDGERWGQAEMVCRNSGPKTPCSWVFRDANNGRQSYSIPFVRVNSCGR